MKLSEHFELADFTRNSRGLANQPPEIVIERLRWLSTFILEPIRAQFQKPLHITSGYRSPEVNRLVGGVENSFHQGLDDHAACDFQVLDAPRQAPLQAMPASSLLQDVFDWIRLESGLLFDRVILERGAEERHEYDDCIHVQISANPRRQALVGQVYNRGAYIHVEVRPAPQSGFGAPGR